MNKFKELRKKNGYDQKFIALTLGIRAPSVSDWETGKSYPTVENLMKLADLYHVTVDELLGRATGAEITALQAAGVSMDEKHILLLYRSLSDQGKEHIFNELVRAQATMKKPSAGEGAALPAEA